MYLTPFAFVLIRLSFEYFIIQIVFLSNLLLTTELYIVSLHIRVDIPNKSSITEVSTRISFLNNFKNTSSTSLLFFFFYVSLVFSCLSLFPFSLSLVSLPSLSVFFFPLLSSCLLVLSSHSFFFSLLPLLSFSTLFSSLSLFFCSTLSCSSLLSPLFSSSLSSIYFFQ